MMTLIVAILMLIEYKNNTFTKSDWKYALGFFCTDVINFTVAYLLFT